MTLPRLSISPPRVVLGSGVGTNIHFSGCAPRKKNQARECTLPYYRGTFPMHAAGSLNIEENHSKISRRKEKYQHHCAVTSNDAHKGHTHNCSIERECGITGRVLLRVSASEGVSFVLTLSQILRSRTTSSTTKRGRHAKAALHDNIA